MRNLLYSVSSFTFTMVLALFAFAYTTINYPGTMHYLLLSASHVRDQVIQLNLPDRYMVWVDLFLLQGNQIVLVGFSIAVRLLLAIVAAIFGPRPVPSNAERPSSSRPASNSLFSRWGSGARS